jgi:hypothetical protein
MTSSTNDDADSAAQAVIVLFASINSYMSEIETILRSRPAVSKVTRSCDVWKFPGGEWALPDRFSFKVHVEAETKIGEVFYWSFELLLESEKWTLSRDIERQENYGPGSIRDFESVTYESFSELQVGYAPLMSEFVRSAENFAFPPSS